jgi:hypothetical protein
MVTQATQNLIATVCDPSASEADLRAVAQPFLQGLARATVGEANTALAALAQYISLDDPSRAAFVALVCGAVVEGGGDPSAIIQSLNRRLQSLLESAAALADACLARMPQAENKGHDPAALDNVRQQVACTMPVENAAWEALNQLWKPAIAVYSVSALARAEVRGLSAFATKIAAYHEGGHWLRLMLSVLDNEPILAIAPQTRVGILARISGIVDNFQLNVLLMDGFPRSGLLARRRVPKRMVDVARGIGPQQTTDTVTGVWNLYTWKAIEPGFKLPDLGDYGASGNWIWNEGSPEDIPIFEGRRVILLGPASYARSWGSQRMFDKLPAKLECEHTLSKGEVTAWLQRMVSSKCAT